MNIYEMMKSGMTSTEIEALFKQEYEKAEKIVNEENAKAKKQEEKEVLLSEGRAHTINAIIAYAEALGEPIAEAEIPKLEADIKDLESELLSMWELFKNLNIQISTNKSKKEHAKAQAKDPMSSDALQKTIQDLLKGLL